MGASHREGERLSGYPDPFVRAARRTSTSRASHRQLSRIPVARERTRSPSPPVRRIPEIDRGRSWVRRVPRVRPDRVERRHVPVDRLLDRAARRQAGALHGPTVDTRSRAARAPARERPASATKHACPNAHSMVDSPRRPTRTGADLTTSRSEHGTTPLMHPAEHYFRSMREIRRTGAAVPETSDDLRGARDAAERDRRRALLARPRRSDSSGYCCTTRTRPASTGEWASTPPMRSPAGAPGEACSLPAAL